MANTDGIRVYTASSSEHKIEINGVTQSNASDYTDPGYNLKVNGSANILGPLNIQKAGILENSAIYANSNGTTMITSYNATTSKDTGLGVGSNESNRGLYADGSWILNYDSTETDSTKKVTLNGNVPVYLNELQDIEGTKVFKSHPRIVSSILYWTAASASDFIGGIFTNTPSSYPNRCDRIYFREYTYNSSTNSTITSYWEQYRLPEVAANLSTSLNYDILTTKNLVEVSQGGTGISSNPSLLVNLASTAASSIFATSPRPGITGVLPITYGGTGVSSIAEVKNSLGFKTFTISANNSKNITIANNYRGILFIIGAGTNYCGFYYISASGSGNITIITEKSASVLTTSTSTNTLTLSTTGTIYGYILDINNTSTV